jgi:hypothetical protein
MIIGTWNHPLMLTLLQRDYQERRTLGLGRRENRHLTGFFALSIREMDN